MALATLTIDIAARLAKFESDLGRMATVAQNQATRMERSFVGVRGALAALGAGGAAVGALAAVAGAIKRAADSADELGKVSQRTGIAVEALSGLKYAAAQSEVEFGDLTKSLQHLNKNIDEGSEAFDRLGIDPAQFKSTDEVLLAIADRFSQTKDGAAKTAIALELFGKAGAAMIPFLNQGSRGIGDLSRELERLGGKVTTETALAADRLNDNLDRLGNSVGYLGTSLANKLIPYLADVTEGMSEAHKESGGWLAAMKDWIDEPTFFWESLPDKIEKTSQVLADLKRNQAELAESGGTNIFGKSAEDLQIKIDKLEKSMQRWQTTLALSKVKVNETEIFDPRDAAARARIKMELPPAPQEDKAAEAAKRQYDQRIEQLRNQADKLRELTVLQETLRDIEAGRFGQLQPARRAELLAAAQAVDALNREREARHEAAEEQKRLRAEEERAIEAARASREAYLAEVDSLRALADPAEAATKALQRLSEIQAQSADTSLPKLNAEQERAVRLTHELQQISAAYGGPAEQYLRALDPARAYREELERINAMERAGALGAAEAEAARGMAKDARAREIFPELEQWQNVMTPLEEYEQKLLDLSMAVDAGFISPEQAAKAGQAIEDQFNAKLEKSKSIAEEIGLTFTSAFEEAIIGGKGLDDVFKGLQQDLLQLSVRKAITEPLLEAVGGMFKVAGKGGGAGGGNWLGALFGMLGFAQGGVMTSQGPLPLRYFASGGIARGPMAAIFGEGAQAEAFVPLPDGRRIDVNLRERNEQRGTVNVTMNIQTPDAASFRRSQQQMLGEMQAQLARAGARR